MNKKIALVAVLVLVAIALLVIKSKRDSKVMAYCYYKSTHGKYDEKREAGADYFRACLESKDLDYPFPELLAEQK